MVVFDLQALQSEAFRARGIGRYVADLARTVAAEHPGAVDVFAWNDRLPFAPVMAELGLGDRLRSFSELRGAEVDVLHVNAPFDMLDLAELAVPVRAGRTVVTCYDLIPYRFANVYLADPADRARYVARLSILNAADAVVTDSRSAADDVTEMVGVDPWRVTVIGGGVGRRFVPPTAPLAERMAELRGRFPTLRPGFVLAPTGIDWRKNVDGTIAAYALLPERLRRRHQLVVNCAMAPEQRRWVEDLVASAGVGDTVILTGHVPDDVLVLLYQTAELVVVASHYEGFGLPVLEARRCGARVICSGASSLPEVLPREYAWFDSTDPADVAGVVERALTDVAFARMLDQIPDPGCTWEAAADRLTAVYRSLGNPNRPRRQGGGEVRRLGVVTLLRPTRSGIADHSERLLAAMHDELDDIEVTAFVAGAVEVERTADFTVEPLAALAERWVSGDLDAVLYCMGNNRFHREIRPLVDLVPGHVLLHDVRLVEAFEPSVFGSIGISEDDLRSPGVFGSSLVTKSAVSVLVHSRHAVDLVRADSGVEAVNVGPLPCPRLPAPANGEDDGLPWVVSAGSLHDTKLSSTVVAALAEVGRRGVARVAVVGAGGELYVDDDDGIVTTGYVTDEEFDDWLRRASLVVQLRRVSNGESSGVVPHSLAHGSPLIVSDLGSMSELPDAVAVKVPVDVGVDELVDTVVELLADGERRRRMRDACLAHAARETAAAQARRIADAIFGD